MLKFVVAIIILAIALVFLVGFVKLVHTVDELPAKADQKRKAEDKAILDWANSPTPGADAGSH